MSGSSDSGSAIRAQMRAWLSDAAVDAVLTDLDATLAGADQDAWLHGTGAWLTDLASSRDVPPRDAARRGAA